MRIAALCEISHFNIIRGMAVNAECYFYLFTEGKNLINSLQQRSFDLIIIDFELLNISGEEIVVWIRQNLVDNPPILFLSSYLNKAQIVGGLDAGADGFVGKPVCEKTLNAQVNALLRRTYPSQHASRIVFGPYRFFPMAQKVEFGDQLVDLGYIEYQLSILFFKNIGRQMSRESLHKSVWGTKFMKTSRALDTQISKLRTKLDLRQHNQYFLSSVYGFGYCLKTIDDATLEPLCSLTSY